MAPEVTRIEAAGEVDGVKQAELPCKRSDFRILVVLESNDAKSCLGSFASHIGEYRGQ
jgi:hypothetical protein